MKTGILGGGQLGLMLALAGFPLGLQFVFLDPKRDAPAGRVAPLITGDFDDPACLDELASRVDCVTFDFENVPVAAVRRLAEKRPVWPPVAALETAQDRLLEKTLFTRLGVPVAPNVAVDSRDELIHAVAKTGLPAVLKTRRMGYDGKGQYVLRTQADVEPAWQALGGVALLLEGFVDFAYEVSLIAVRGRDGHTAFYPLTQNTHRDGILRLSRAPLHEPALQQAAEAHAGRVLSELDYVGVLAIEFFVVADQLVANEMAPRVHNSGHWTIEAARTSQFQNHLRAVVGLPLGATEAVGEVAMLNCIGSEPDPAAVAAVPGASLHLYGKQPRPGRKVGHVTAWADSAEGLSQQLARLQPLVDPQADGS